jgi:hypothetical protein
MDPGAVWIRRCFAAVALCAVLLAATLIHLFYADARMANSISLLAKEAVPAPLCKSHKTLWTASATEAEKRGARKEIASSVEHAVNMWQLDTLQKGGFNPDPVFPLINCPECDKIAERQLRLKGKY